MNAIGKRLAFFAPLFVWCLALNAFSAVPSDTLGFLEPTPDTSSRWLVSASASGVTTERFDRDPGLPDSLKMARKVLTVKVSGKNPSGAPAKLQLFVVGDLYGEGRLLLIQEADLGPSPDFSEEVRAVLYEYPVSASDSVDNPARMWAIRIVSNGRIVFSAGSPADFAADAGKNSARFCSLLLAENRGNALKREPEVLKSLSANLTGAALCQWLYDIASVEQVRTKKIRFPESTQNQARNLIDSELLLRWRTLGEIAQSKADSPSESSRKTWLESFALFCKSMAAKDEKAARSVLNNLMRP